MMKKYKQFLNNVFNELSTYFWARDRAFINFSTVSTTITNIKYIVEINKKLIQI